MAVESAGGFGEGGDAVMEGVPGNKCACEGVYRFARGAAKVGGVEFQLRRDGDDERVEGDGWWSAAVVSSQMCDEVVLYSGRAAAAVA